jgi:hypothetical protein
MSGSSGPARAETSRQEHSSRWRASDLIGLGGILVALASIGMQASTAAADRRERESVTRKATVGSELNDLAAAMATIETQANGIEYSLVSDKSHALPSQAAMDKLNGAIDTLNTKIEVARVVLQPNLSSAASLVESAAQDYANVVYTDETSNVKDFESTKQKFQAFIGALEAFQGSSRDYFQTPG